MLPQGTRKSAIYSPVVGIGSIWKNFSSSSSCGSVVRWRLARPSSRAVSLQASRRGLRARDARRVVACSDTVPCAGAGAARAVSDSVRVHAAVDRACCTGGLGARLAIVISNANCERIEAAKCASLISLRRVVLLNCLVGDPPDNEGVVPGKVSFETGNDFPAA